ncbi:mitochondrial ribosomal protein L37-domain-containing protein [Catenaria anguillulae PL171]|uniref:Large ribosomal subunit protein mL54 n=1 Tax=Catenaria anguillulae PL171 TaxID=765915 RepID=A0A1Y2I017_9FUNG|nr:mitochondrial ribosomal protein L37-domain-containing protein [Catenaria anguillulae PL171]
MIALTQCILARTSAASPTPAMAACRSIVAATSTSFAVARSYSSRPPSTLAEGTEIPINYIKGGKHPVALKDEEYPEWLWTIAQPPKKEWSPREKRSANYLKFERTEAIKLKNFIKSR